MVWWKSKNKNKKTEVKKMCNIINEGAVYGSHDELVTDESTTGRSILSERPPINRAFLPRNERVIKTA